jgi:DNA-binding NarL/FixJ family response regulator
MSIRVALADDQALIREGFRAILERADDIEVVGEASDGVEAIELTRRLHPDVVIMDIRMPRLDGIAATVQITSDTSLASTRVLVVTTFEMDSNVFAALRAGASGFLLKDLEPDDLRRAVRVVAGGESLLAPSVTRRLIAQFVSTDVPDPLDEPGQPGQLEQQAHVRAERPELRAQPEQYARKLSLLTDREREIVGLVGEGLSNAEIAARLFISPTTAKTHVSRAMQKLDARDRAQLVVFAYDSGIASSPKT